MHRTINYFPIHRSVMSKNDSHSAFLIMNAYYKVSELHEMVFSC